MPMRMRMLRGMAEGRGKNEEDLVRRTFEMEEGEKLGRVGIGLEEVGGFLGFGIWVWIFYLESRVLFLYHVVPLGWKERKEKGTDIAS